MNVESNMNATDSMRKIIFSYESFVLCEVHASVYNEKAVWNILEF